MFVVGKNYRVQNIQLSKISLAGLCRQSVYVGCARCATEAALNKASPDVGVRETHKPHSLTETFSASARGWPAWPKPRSCYGAAKAGGEYRARTGDLLVANQALSQLS